MPGWPGISAGDRLTVVLGKADNWQTLAGWKNHSTGEVVLPNTSRLLLGIWQGVVLSIVGCLLFAQSTTPAGHSFSAGMVGLSMLLSLYLVAQRKRQKSQTFAIQQTKPSDLDYPQVKKSDL